MFMVREEHCYINWCVLNVNVLRFDRSFCSIANVLSCYKLQRQLVPGRETDWKSRHFCLVSATLCNTAISAVPYYLST